MVDSMKSVLVLVTTHRGLSDETYESILRLGTDAIMKSKGGACIDLARSRALDQAVEALKQYEQFDTVLMVDDDMVFGLAEAQATVDESRQYCHPVSARYATQGGKLCAVNVGTPLYFTGLGFMAVPRKWLFAVAESLAVLGGIRRWCWTGEVLPEFPDTWCSEDFVFCSHFRDERGSRGVRLGRAVVGHQKLMALKPRDDAQLIIEPKIRTCP
jgi:hypothetical protein